MEREATWVESRVGAPVDRLERLPGGAGARRYLRAHLCDGRSAVLMHALPEDPEILPPALRGRDSVAEFVEATRFLAAEGVPVPEILGVEARERWILLEDLGDLRLCDLDAGRLRERQHEAVDLLARVHALDPPAGAPFERRFDEAWIRFELAHFLDYAAAPEWRARLEPGLAALARAISRLPEALSLRDYQSQNLLIDAQGRLRVVDYQDAFRAPRELDLVALVHDSYVETSNGQRASLIERYAAHSGSALSAASIALLTVQRKCKDLGRFLYMCRVKGDVRYRPWVRTARRAVLEALPRLPGELWSLSEPLREVLAEGAS
jgi:aminoglycoside/choline kinase family phosphotransferase